MQSIVYHYTKSERDFDSVKEANQSDRLVLPNCGYQIFKQSYVHVYFKSLYTHEHTCKQEYAHRHEYMYSSHVVNTSHEARKHQGLEFDIWNSMLHVHVYTTKQVKNFEMLEICTYMYYGANTGQHVWSTCT